MSQYCIALITDDHEDNASSLILTTIKAATATATAAGVSSNSKKQTTEGNVPEKRCLVRNMAAQHVQQLACRVGWRTNAPQEKKRTKHIRQFGKELPSAKRQFNMTLAKVMAGQLCNWLMKILSLPMSSMAGSP